MLPKTEAPAGYNSGRACSSGISLKLWRAPSPGMASRKRSRRRCQSASPSTESNIAAAQSRIGSALEVATSRGRFLDLPVLRVQEAAPDVALQARHLHPLKLVAPRRPVRQQHDADAAVGDGRSGFVGPLGDRHVLVTRPDVEHGVRRRRLPPLKREEVGVGEEVAPLLAVAVVEGGDAGHDQQGSSRPFAALRSEQPEPVGPGEAGEVAGVRRRLPAVDDLEIGAREDCRAVHAFSLWAEREDFGAVNAYRSNSEGGSPSG